MEKLIHFMAERCKKYALYQKFLRIKDDKDSIRYKKVSGRICLFPPGLKLGAPKIAIFEINYISFWIILIG